MKDNRGVPRITAIRIVTGDASSTHSLPGAPQAFPRVSTTDRCLLPGWGALDHLASGAHAPGPAQPAPVTRSKMSSKVRPLDVLPGTAVRGEG